MSSRHDNMTVTNMILQGARDVYSSNSNFHLAKIYCKRKNSRMTEQLGKECVDDTIL